MYYMGFSYIEAYNIPIWQRIWYLKRVQKEIKDSQGASRAAHANGNEARALMGRHRHNVPANLRRFT
tara:strand:- start:1061 stop:1261 length:201 start_codon:yes stop_codon:yes gene_type:complete